MFKNSNNNYRLSTETDRNRIR